MGKKDHTKKKQRSSFFTFFSTNFKKLDQYGEAAGFEVAGGQTYPTCLGALITFVVFVITASYLIKRFQTMINY